MMVYRFAGFAFFLLISLLSFGAAACADSSVNLFAEHVPGLKKTWKPAGTIEVEETAGGPLFRIEADERNDLSLIREIPVEKGAYYRFSARIRTENVFGPIGANLGIYKTYNHTSGLTGDHGWTEVSEVFRAVETGTAPFALRLGYWDAPSRGTAWFRDVRVERLENWQGFYQPMEETPPKEPLSTLPFRALIFFFLVPFTIFCLAWLRNGWFSRGSNDLGGGRLLRRHRGFWGLLAAAFFVRLIMSPYQGMSADIGYLKSLALQLGAGPDLFLAFFQGDNPQGLPLLCTYLLAGIGALVRTLNWEASQLFVILLKMPAILCELGLVALILQMMRKWGAGNRAWLCAALIAFHPVLLLLTPFWGQLGIIQAAFLLAGLLALFDRRPLQAGLIFGLGISPDIRFVLLALLLVGAAARLSGGSAAFKTALGCLLSGIILCLPKLVGGGGGWLDHLLPPQLGALTAFNVWTMFGLNWQPLTMPVWVAGIGLGTALLAAGLWSLPRRSPGATEEGRRLQTLIVFSLFCAALFLFLPGMQARFLLPALIFLIPALGLGMRHRWTFFFLSLFMFFNLAHVFWDSAYLGQRPSADSPGIRIVAGLLVLLWLVAVMFEAWWRRRRKMKAVEKGGKKVFGDIALPRDSEPLQSPPFKMRPGDWIALLLITALGAGLIFFRIGEWNFPIRGLTIQEESAIFEIDLGSPHKIAKAGFFGGEIAPEIRFLRQEEGRWRPLWSRRDGLLYYYTRQDYRKTFKNAERSFPAATADKLRLIVYGRGATVNEIIIFDAEGRKIIPEKIHSLDSGDTSIADQHPFFDEPEKANLIGSYRTKTYWDEVFYARSAYDLVQGSEPYEKTHPPLGKSLIGIGIWLFDMTPFGWRFVPAFFGSLMPILMFLGGRYLTGRRVGAYVAATLTVFECLFFTNSRWANIDVFLVFFLTAMLVCLCRTGIFKEGGNTRNEFVFLLLAGVFFGLAVSIKWSALFTAFALFLLVAGQKLSVLAGVITGGGDQRKGVRRKGKEFLPQAYAWILCFGFVPIALYYFSHASLFTALPGQPGPLSLRGLGAFVDQQAFILGFHGGKKALEAHSLGSQFFSWPLMLKPVQGIFLNNDFENLRSSISLIGNPIIWWSGLVAMLLLGWKSLRRPDKVLLFLTGIYFFQFLPWILVQRPTFLYAYQPFLPVLIWGLACWVASSGDENHLRAWLRAGIITCCAALAFLLFFPAISGLPVSEDYFIKLRWFATWSGL